MSYSQQGVCLIQNETTSNSTVMREIPPSGSPGPLRGVCTAGPVLAPPFSPHLCCFDLTEAGLKGLGEKPAGMFSPGGGAPGGGCGS